MYYKVIENNKERILESKQIRELVKENNNIEVRRLNNTNVNLQYFREKQHRKKKEETVAYIYKKYQQKYYNRLKRNTISKEEYNKIVSMLKDVKNSCQDAVELKNEYKLIKL